MTTPDPSAQSAQPKAHLPTRRPGIGGDSEATRVAMIVDAALRLGREAGTLDELTMRALAGRLGVSPTALYQYFDTKRSLVRAAHAKAAAKLIEQLGRALAVDDEPTSALTRWVESYATVDLRDPWLAGLFPANRFTTSQTWEDRAELIGLAAVRQVLERAAERGQLAPEVSVDLAARMVWAGAHAIATARSSMGDQCRNDDAWIRRLASALILGIHVPARGARDVCVVTV